MKKKMILSLPHGYRKSAMSVDVAPAVTAHSYECNNLLTDIKKKTSKIKIRMRKLTPRECFRLMGLSDSDIDKIQTAGVSSSQQYKMAGNSIVVQVLEGIFIQMFNLDDDPAEPGEKGGEK